MANRLDAVTAKSALKTLLPWCAISLTPLLFWILIELGPETKKDPSPPWPNNGIIEQKVDFVLFATLALAGLGGLLTQALLVVFARQHRWPEDKLLLYGRRVSVPVFFLVGFVAFLVLFVIRPGGCSE